MTDASVYDVSKDSAVSLERTSLAAEGLLERQHLQDWALHNPAILGDDLLVITDEFDRWQDFIGNPLSDRLDVLALDSDGRPVVVELKRGAAPRTTELQAVQYAAMVSRFSEDELAQAHVSFLDRRGESTDFDGARERLGVHTGDRLSEQRIRSPRIVLLAEEFGPVVTASVVWMSQQIGGIDGR